MLSDLSALFDPPQAPPYVRCVCGNIFKTGAAQETYCSVNCAHKDSLKALSGGDSHYYRRSLRDGECIAHGQQTIQQVGPVHASKPKRKVHDAATTTSQVHARVNGTFLDGFSDNVPMEQHSLCDAKNTRPKESVPSSEMKHMRKVSSTVTLHAPTSSHPHRDASSSSSVRHDTQRVKQRQRPPSNEPEHEGDLAILVDTGLSHPAAQTCSVSHSLGCCSTLSLTPDDPQSKISADVTKGSAAHDVWMVVRDLSSLEDSDCDPRARFQSQLSSES
ncbi:hypothetical protein AcW1_007778 [Taiwanofungus camphoratus]|nr:hypothetical protein AcW1_007778 [Antrodia cinnamomea]